MDQIEIPSSYFILLFIRFSSKRKSKKMIKNETRFFETKCNFKKVFLLNIKYDRITKNEPLLPTNDQ